MQNTPGADDVKIEQAGGLPVLSIIPDKTDLQRYGLNIADVQNVIQVVKGDKEAGQLFEGDKRFDIVVRLPSPFEQILTL
ncbi:efflux RND transporter permease subunit [Legionella pneumophila]|uniref:efflux RND transporter permease subunit n=1 Tax=Legionella pneumophila TaxID=446 RepID=UPI003EEC6CAC